MRLNEAKRKFLFLSIYHICDILQGKPTQLEHFQDLRSSWNVSPTFVCYLGSCWEPWATPWCQPPGMVLHVNQYHWRPAVILLTTSRSSWPGLLSWARPRWFTCAASSTPSSSPSCGRSTWNMSVPQDTPRRSSSWLQASSSTSGSRSHLEYSNLSLTQR